MKATKPESDKVTWKTGAKSCHLAMKGPDLAATTTAIANGCVDTTKMHQVGSPTTGEGQASSATMVKTIPLAAKANHCYRVLGLAEPTVTDFDVAIMDSAGKLAGEDTTDSNDAIVLEDGAICFNVDDNVNVNTAVAMRAGEVGGGDLGGLTGSRNPAPVGPARPRRGLVEALRAAVEAAPPDEAMGAQVLDVDPPRVGVVALVVEHEELGDEHRTGRVVEGWSAGARWDGGRA